MQIMRAVAGSQILILQLFLHFHFSSLHVSRNHSSVLVISLSCLCSNTSKQWTFLLHFLTRKAKGSWWLHHDNIAAYFRKHFSNVTILVDMVSSDHMQSLLVMIQPWIQLHTPLHVTILWDHVISVMGLLHRYNNRTCYCWAERLTLRRNWVSQTKPAERYLIPKPLSTWQLLTTWWKANRPALYLLFSACFLGNNWTCIFLRETRNKKDLYVRIRGKKCALFAISGVGRVGMLWVVATARGKELKDMNYWV